MQNKKLLFGIILLVVVFAAGAALWSQKRGGQQANNNNTTPTPTPVPTQVMPYNMDALTLDSAKTIFPKVLFEDSGAKLQILNQITPKENVGATEKFVQYTLQYETTKKIADNEKAFRTALEADGWNVGKTFSQGGMSVMSSTKDNKSLSITQTIKNKQTVVQAYLVIKQ